MIPDAFVLPSQRAEDGSNVHQHEPAVLRDDDESLGGAGADDSAALDGEIASLLQQLCKVSLQFSPRLSLLQYPPATACVGNGRSEPYRPF